jgi:magnesium transporter
MVTIFVHADGGTEQASRIDPAWLQAESGRIVWVDLHDPSPEEMRLLTDVFHFHELAVEDTQNAVHHPKVEAYDGYLYLILHGIDFEEAAHGFATHPIDFFVGPTYLVTVHDGTSRSIQQLRRLCAQSRQLLAEGPGGLLHRIIDAMVDNYRPEVDKVEEKLDLVEEQVFENPRPELLRAILDLKQDATSLRRVTVPQRDVVGRLARREFPFVTEALAYRYRDVYDHLVRLTEEAVVFHDRITSLVDAHLANQSNQLSQTMRVLTVIATVFMPLTLVTGIFGMNVDLPHIPPGGTAAFWEIFLAMLAISGGMLWVFKKRGWL